MRKLISIAIGLGLLVAPAGIATADDIEGGSDFVEATLATEQGNLAHYGQVAGQATGGGNISCRAERPAFVSQPEIDGRITVKGEDDAATSIECVDLMLEAQDLIYGELYVEYLPLHADPVTGWQLVDETMTPVSGRMVKGVGVAPGVLSYVFPANHVSQGRPHRACIDAYQPANFDPLCQTFASVEKKRV